MSNERIICSHCGAVQKKGATLCDLCGSPVDGSDIEQASVVEADEINSVSESAPSEAQARDSSRGGFCTSCGAAFPVGARFCGSCGEKLVGIGSAPVVEDPQDGSPPPQERATPPDVPKSKRAATDKELGRQVLLVLGAAVVLIVALFVVTAVSRDRVSNEAGDAGESVAEFVPAPLAPEVQAAVETIRAEIDSLAGDEKLSKLRELADFLVSHGRWDVAAGVQAELAQVTGIEADWVRSGNLYYDWMDGIEGEAKAAYARKAVESYQNALQINPDNLDVRTDMAIAYMFDPDNSVQAIAQTNMVLEADSLHIQANFNRGIMLLRINRFEEAAFQFNKVMRIVADPQNPIYQRAESALDAIRQAGI